MLRYSFGMQQEAAAIENAVSQTLKEGYRTVDIAGGAPNAVGCRRMGELVAERI